MDYLVNGSIDGGQNVSIACSCTGCNGCMGKCTGCRGCAGASASK